MIALLSKEMSAALVGNKFSPKSIENFISHEKNLCSQWLITAQNLQRIKPFLALKLSQYSKSGSTFSSSAGKPVEAHSNCCRFKNALCLCSSVWTAQAAAQRAWPSIFQSKRSIIFWNSLWKRLPDDLRWLKLGLEIELCRLESCEGFICSEIPE